ncbi:hypothetical protein JRO89_XS01G0265700 [Xanthoceras sorbifolium]|uniref:Uncharacterized protein n=1 Tax=Xanthoceras sorbifolium TaxID=99658 RepID=A0ABQ8ILI9_9ROSI|nr:hypothetical protein JRO89_XS01G0265700 [Xanthoceras sorbifolium]
MANDEIPPPPTLTVTSKEITVPSISTDPSKCYSWTDPPYESSSFRSPSVFLRFTRREVTTSKHNIHCNDSGSSAAMAVQSNNSGNKSTPIRYERFNRPYGSHDFLSQEKQTENFSGGRQDKRRSGSGRVLNAHIVEKWAIGSKLVMTSMGTERAIQRQNIIQAQNVSIIVISLQLIMCLKPFPK